MVRLNRIVTRGGDRGQTSLGDGTRLPKHHPRIAAIGAVDETNAVIGLVRLHTATPGTTDADAMLARIQQDLFDLGADLCTPGSEAADGALRVAPAQVRRLETEIEAMNRGLPPLESFVLPGGSAASAHLHLARTVARRAERHMTELAAAEPVNPTALQYVNRLSDHLFVLGRVLNAGADVLWRPGANR